MKVAAGIRASRAAPLSAAYRDIKRLRSIGDSDAAIAALRASRPTSDRDAFEAAICLFVCGDLDSALNVCRSYGWKEKWAVQISGALEERLQNGNAERALSLARAAVESGEAPEDASAVYLLILKDLQLIDEADAYIKRRFADLPLGETFLLTLIGEIALYTRDWRQAYRTASAVLAIDPDDYRALVALSIANYEIGNIHEALGNANRASVLQKGSLPATLQVMRGQNKLGDYYAVLAAFDKLEPGITCPADIHLELGTAYAGLENPTRAIAEYRSALIVDPRSISALRALVQAHVTSGDATALHALTEEHASSIYRDLECMYWLGLGALARRDLDQAASMFSKTLARANEVGEARTDLTWPVPEPRIRHDYEQLELLEQRGRLDDSGREAANVLKHYYLAGGNPDVTFSPSGAEADALKNVLCETYYVPDLPFTGRALGENDYAAIEEEYFAQRVVVIDNFLSQEALAELRRFCEEATIWKIDNKRGYVGAVLAQGFSTPVLLSISDQLKDALPRVIADHPLLQAWGFKYDQRMQGINMHADFAKVNVNFWITADEACADPTTGGLVVYDVPVPKSWTFADYNTESDKLAAYVKVHSAKPHRIGYRANRCVLFDSSLIHISDEMRFKAGYENRRVNITLLYGRARTVE